MSTDLTLTWDSVAGWPTVGDFIIRLDNAALTVSEYYLCTSVNVGANQTTGVRNQEGSGASAFAINDTGGNDLTAQMMADAFVRLDTAASQTLTGPLVVPPAIGVAAAPTSYGSLPVKIAEVLLVAIAASVSFTSIPAGFRTLKTKYYAKEDPAVATDNMLIRVNNDTGTNYDGDRVIIAGTAVGTPIEALGANGGVAGVITGASATAGYFAQGEVTIVMYAGVTGDKLIQTESAYADSNLTAHAAVMGKSVVKWRTVGIAINREDFFPGSGNFIVGSYFSPWGEP